MLGCLFFRTPARQCECVATKKGSVSARVPPVRGDTGAGGKPKLGDGRISHQPEDAPQGGGWHRPAVLSSPEAQVIDVEVDDRGTWREPSFAQVGVPHCCKVKHGGIVLSYDFYVTRPHTELQPQSLAEYAQAVRSFFPHGKALKSMVEGSSRRWILPSRIRPRCLGCQARSLLIRHWVRLRVFQPPTGGPRELPCVRS